MSNQFFFTIEKSSREQYLGKLLSGLFVIVALGAGVGLYMFGSQSFAKSDIAVAEAVIPFDIPEIDIAQAGDIFIAPPVVEAPKLPRLEGELPPVSDLSAYGMIVKDAESGVTLYQKNEYEAWPIASITKLMSALVVLEKDIDWDATTQVVPDDLIDTHMYAGDSYTLQELWNSALVASSNKAIMTLSDTIGWEREAFVARMNEKAVELGMEDSRFTEPTGLDAGNISTPADIVILLEEALRQEEIVAALSLKEQDLYSAERQKSHHMWNTNWLRLGWVPHSFEETIGKTGFITASGYNFSMRVTNDEGRALYVVALGTNAHEARFTEARDTAAAVFSSYIWPDQEGYDPKDESTIEE